MPGISFLFKKKFHPSRTDNQKRLFVAEHTKAQRTEQDVAAENEIRKERELQQFEEMGDMQQRDPRTAALRFMYTVPKQKNTGGEDVVIADSTCYEAPIVDGTGDDLMVKQFKAKWAAKTSKEPITDLAANVEQARDSTEQQPQDQCDLVQQQQETGHKYVMRSALENAVGIKYRLGATHEEQVQRHPFLKNAPIEGAFAKHMQVQHNPFNRVVRNVRCLRCGEWGHRSGDRECRLLNSNPLDQDRQKREDPMICHSIPGAVVQGQGSADGEDSSDPEAEFIATLTRREKKLLLRKLHKLQQHQYDDKDGKKRSHHHSSSDSDQSSSSNECTAKKKRRK